MWQEEGVRQLEDAKKVLGTELESSGRTVSTPNCCATSPAPLLVNLASDIHNHFQYFPKLFIRIESNRKTHDSQILSANNGHMIMAISISWSFIAFCL